jgi:hypothetical protein
LKTAKYGAASVVGSMRKPKTRVGQSLSTCGECLNSLMDGCEKSLAPAHEIQIIVVSTID